MREQKDKHRKALFGRAGLLLVTLTLPASGVEEAVAQETIDTIIIAPNSPVHPGGGRLVLDLTIGVQAGPAEYSLGFVSDFTVSPGGDIYVVDAPSANPVIRQYDPNGRYVRQIGRVGAGPGEYRAPRGLATTLDGQLLVYDYANSRINVYSKTGEPEDTWRIPPFRSFILNYGRRLQVDSEGRLLIRFNPVAVMPRDPMALASVPAAIARLGQGGEIIDTIHPPSVQEIGQIVRIPGDPGTVDGTARVPYSPRAIAVWSPLGYYVTARGDKYEIDMGPGGPGSDTAVRSVRRNVQPVQIAEAERVDLSEDLAQRMRTGRGRVDIPDLPRVKPIIRGILIGMDGRIWVQLSQPSRIIPSPQGTDATTPGWSEPVVFDVFEPDGTYLGAVRAPDGLSLIIVRGDELWAVTKNELDVPFIKRFHIEWSEANNR